MPRSQPIDSLLQKFQKTHKHIAVVLDEYGGVDGIVSLEDIIEEVLGKRNYPIIYNFDRGHTIPSLMISQDSLLSLKANHKTGIKVEILKNSYID